MFSFTFSPIMKEFTKPLFGTKRKVNLRKVFRISLVFLSFELSFKCSTPLAAKKFDWI